MFSSQDLCAGFVAPCYSFYLLCSSHLKRIYLHCVPYSGHGSLPKMSKKTTPSPSSGMSTGSVLRSKSTRRIANSSSKAKRHGET